MKMANQIIDEYIARNSVDMNDFWEWHHDARYSQEEANVHDSRFPDHLETYVTERENGR